MVGQKLPTPEFICPQFCGDLRKELRRLRFDVERTSKPAAVQSVKICCLCAGKCLDRTQRLPCSGHRFIETARTSNKFLSCLCGHAGYSDRSDASIQRCCWCVQRGFRTSGSRCWANGTFQRYFNVVHNVEHTRR